MFPQVDQHKRTKQLSLDFSNKYSYDNHQCAAQRSLQQSCPWKQSPLSVMFIVIIIALSLRWQLCGVGISGFRCSCIAIKLRIPTLWFWCLQISLVLNLHQACETQLCGFGVCRCHCYCISIKLANPNCVVFDSALFIVIASIFSLRIPTVCLLGVQF